jgi:hypothetical protein
MYKNMNYYVIESGKPVLMAPFRFSYGLSGYEDARELAGILGGVVTAESWLMRRVIRQPRTRDLKNRADFEDVKREILNK